MYEKKIEVHLNIYAWNKPYLYINFIIELQFQLIGDIVWTSCAREGEDTIWFKVNLNICCIS